MSLRLSSFAAEDEINGVVSVTTAPRSRCIAVSKLMRVRVEQPGELEQPVDLVIGQVVDREQALALETDLADEGLDGADLRVAGHPAYHPSHHLLLV